ncbi:MAG TPA: hypothetical protein VFT89_12050 [Rhizobiaceae bacterium]|nr:hypothetical protein [Rhizobiaceae bacterium]
MLEEKAREAIIDELKRQAELRPDKLKVTASERRLEVNGEIDVDALVMVVISSMAGGP